MPHAAKLPDDSARASRVARFSASTVAALDRAKILGLRAGRGTHRFIGVWPIVVDGRLFIRSWGRSPTGWHAALRAEPVATIEVGTRRLRVRAIRTRSGRLLAAVDAAYRAKYPTPGSRAYVRDFCRPACRATTTELAPLAPAH